MSWACLALLGSACGSSEGNPGPSNPGSSGGSASQQAGAAGAGATAGSLAATSGSSAGGSAGAESTGGSATSAGSAGEAMGGSAGMGGAPMTWGKPNIVVVLLDDMGYSDLGTYGGEIRTPHIDALAKGGTRFRNYYVTPRCSPTRMSLMTGAYTQQVADEPGQPLPTMRTKNNVTIPEALSAAGYRTYMAGKWHLGTDDEHMPSARGFDHVFGFGPKAAGAEESKWDKTKYGFISKGNAIKARSYGNDFYQSSAIGDYALDYLTYHYAKKDDKPFFMYLAFNSPHFPVQAPRDLATLPGADGGKSYEAIFSKGWNEVRDARYANMLSKGVIDSTFELTPPEPFRLDKETPMVIPDWATLGAAQKADLVRKMALYAACIESVDTAVGRVVERLKVLGQFENTLILVQSDNGGNWEGGVVGSSEIPNAEGVYKESFEPRTGAGLANMGQAVQDGDHVKVGGGWANVETTPFRLYKHYTHGGGVRSPLVVSWPARTMSPGQWTNQVAHVIDVAPTILDAAQVEHPKTYGGHPALPFEGESLVQTIAEGTPVGPRQLGFEHESNRAWIDGNFKMVVRSETGDVVELYDLSTDPTERHDLAQAQPVRTRQMVEAWNAWAKRVGVPKERLLALP